MDPPEMEVSTDGCGGAAGVRACSLLAPKLSCLGQKGGGRGLSRERRGRKIIAIMAGVMARIVAVSFRFCERNSGTGMTMVSVLTQWPH